MKLHNTFVFIQLEEQKAETTSHGIGIKRVLITKNQCESKLMQAAYCTMNQGEEVKSHGHPTMEEFYFFNEGTAVLTIEDVDYSCTSGTFIKIPANAKHSLRVTMETAFVYWGIAI